MQSIYHLLGLHAACRHNSGQKKCPADFVSSEIVKQRALCSKVCIKHYLLELGFFILSFLWKAHEHFFFTFISLFYVMTLLNVRGLWSWFRVDGRWLQHRDRGEHVFYNDSLSLVTMENMFKKMRIVHCEAVLALQQLLLCCELLPPTHFC